MNRILVPLFRVRDREGGGPASADNPPVPGRRAQPFACLWPMKAVQTIRYVASMPQLTRCESVAAPDAGPNISSANPQLYDEPGAIIAFPDVVSGPAGSSPRGRGES